MTLFPFEDYFDLSSYAHKKLFQEKENVWEALGRIVAYLKERESFKIECEIAEGAFLENEDKIAIGKGTVVEAGAYIRGPCIIGENCSIRHGAYIRGNVILGDSCVVGHATEVKNSIFLDKAQAAHFAYVGDCILGNSINLGAGTKCANLKLDGKTVFVRSEKGKFDSERRKFGAIIGDRAQLGCNSVSNPGSLIGKDCFCYPCTVIRGVLPGKTVYR